MIWFFFVSCMTIGRPNLLPWGFSTQNQHKWCKDITWEMLLFLFFVFCKVTFFFSLFRLCKRLDARQTNCRSPTVLSSVTRINISNSESDFWCASTQAVCLVSSNQWVYVSADSDVCIQIFDVLVDGQTQLTDPIMGWMFVCPWNFLSHGLINPVRYNLK